MQREPAGTAAEETVTERSHEDRELDDQELGEPLRAGPDEQEHRGTSTRERILDVALDLFTEKGFDRTSLREVAERVGVTKAALYYHFASKDDILMALHMRLHEFGRVALERIADQKIGIEMWRSLLYEMLDQVIGQRKIFLMHERNQAALEKLHDEEHEAEHDDIQAKVREVLADPSLPLRDRVRMSCSLGAVFASSFLAGDAFDGVSGKDLGGLMRDAIDDVLGARSRARNPRRR